MVTYGIRDALKLFGKMDKEERVYSKPGNDWQYDFAEFEKDMEMIFAYTDDKPKVLMCALCGDTVTVPDDCSCGNLKKICEAVKKSIERKEE